MSGANSNAVLRRRASELGLGDELLDSLDGAHINTFARLAYLTSRDNQMIQFCLIAWK